MRKIIVVGSGIIGLSCALLLAMDGNKVQVITRDPHEATSWVAGGMLAPFSEGLEGELFEFSYQSLKAYPEFIRLLKEVSGQRVDFWQGGIYRVVLKGEENLLKLAEKYKEKGYKVEVIHGHDGLSEEVAFLVHYLEEAWVDAETLMHALTEAVKRLEVEVTIDEVVQVVKEGERVEKLMGIRSEHRGDFYVFATGAWTRQLFPVPVYPVKGQGLKLKGFNLPRVHYSSVSYLIPRDNYLYVGATSEDVGFMGGNTLDGVRKLSEGAIRVAPFLSKALLLGMLYGYRPCTPDEKPILEAGENYMLATGHHRNGILHAPITAQIVLDYLRGSRSPLLDGMSSRRFLTKT